MKYLEDLRNIHKGEEIWVIGAGPSLDAYPLDFFKDKVCIGMNWVFSVFIEIGDRHKKFKSKKFYSVHEHRPQADWIAKHRPDFLKNCFFLLPPRRLQRGHSKFVWWEDYNDDPYYMRWKLCGPKLAQATAKDFAIVADCIMKKGRCGYVCRGTTLHWAAQAAVVLGARKIYLVGASARGGYMRKHGSKYTKIVNYNPKTRTKPWRTGTKAMAEAFRPHGVEIVRYYYGKGVEAI